MTTENSNVWNLKYQTFGRRIGANFIDGFVFFPIAILFVFLQLQLHMSNLLLMFLKVFIVYSYAILMHGAFGQTLGKMATGVKVIDVSETKKLSYKQAFLRDAVPLALNCVFFIITLPMLHGAGVDSNTTKSVLFNPLTIMRIWSLLIVLWSLTEILTMLLNKKRRAVHDFIAKSVVVMKDSVQI